ncbi:inositol hexakisphosphate and diphosphoinositol-pentakisphosphate kinase 2-like isoform X3 [Gigantopelta aegis]|uniref:inositol hexakisphosphate and diphosphoinositol-pentakisphosphate kinase 2-like isoform X3 n=1 Tax=Gigantopelta aegis TaxID=1735272 RepID=UPI001B88BBA8|nr:inositol hexakisphosphate and diphosphoinositol-pentakisphosphate kinase 2-like isoform X3 [Gigantopelta aegis]
MSEHSALHKTVEATHAKADTVQEVKKKEQKKTGKNQPKQDDCNSGNEVSKTDDPRMNPNTCHEKKEENNSEETKSKDTTGNESAVSKENGKDKLKVNQVKFTIGDTQPLDEEQEISRIERPCSAGRNIIVGVCAMSKKSVSKPMKEILERLTNFEKIEIYVFPESVILNESVENWPVVDVLISFFSFGFPLSKAIEYYNLRKPYAINDLQTQYTLMDRRKVYTILMQEEIPHPRYAVLTKEGDEVTCKVHETEDSIEIDGDVFQKPFVEKPVDAEDHNVNIYFPIAAGGGSTRLFRKVKDRSSFYSPMSRVRKAGSYIYEEFMPTDGTDVKVYTVGPDYAHAEARKSPALDGKVERDQDGKEIRYPVLLSAKEKMIAKKVCQAFKQNICGFDLLRANGESYVCDVNGFSFVKTSSKYYDDCAKILGTMITRALAPQLQLEIPWVLGAAPEDIPVVPTTSGPMMELRCVSAIIRHGDRTPKQKMKMEVKHTKFFELFEKYGGFKSAHLKLKKPKQLQEVLDIVRYLLSENKEFVDPEVEEKKAKLQQLKLVLEMYEFTGINRKIQFKYQPWGRPRGSSSSDDEVPREPSLVLIVKWGGELTPAGKMQAEDLGKAFRTLYPGGQGHVRVPGGWTGSTASQDHPKYWILDNHPGQFVDSPGLGFLRLHSTFRHDLKIYASDEGRVQMTAAAFTKGLLALEGELTPILIQMVKSANNNGLLDGEGKTSKYQLYIKEKLKDILNEDTEFTQEHYKKLGAVNNISLVNAMKFVENPRKMCERVHNMIREITTKIRALKLELKKKDLKLYHGESWELLIRRWAKLEKDFKMKNNRFDISKIPDVYDCIKYDLQHNQRTLQFERAEELFMCSKALADIVIPQEYGITVDEKLYISQSYCTPLMRKIHSDLLQCVNHHNEQICDSDATRLDSRYSKGVASPQRFVRTRLYFTSESHIHSLLNMLRYGGLCEKNKDEQWSRAMEFLSATAELNYMTQIVIMLFEDPSKDPCSDERFHMELHFSPGAYTCCDTGLGPPRGMGYRPNPKSDKKDPSCHECSVHFSTSWHSSHQLDMSETDVATSKSCKDLRKSSLEELNEKEIFEHDTSPVTDSSSSESVKTFVKKTSTPLPKSLDPSVPEWDFDDDKQNTEEVPSEKKQTTEEVPSEKKQTTEEVPSEKKQTTEEVPSGKKQTTEEVPSGKKQTTEEVPSGKKQTTEEEPSKEKQTTGDEKQPSDDKQLAIDIVVDKEGVSTQFSESKAKSVSLPIQISPSTYTKTLSSFMSEKVHYEEKRSRSLEDKNSEPDPEKKRSRSLEDKNSKSSNVSDYVQRNYKTVHLPLATERHHHSFSSLFYLNRDVFKAFVGFDMVPSLHPLETLHNALTFKDMDYFLEQATSTKFATPMPSPHSSVLHAAVTAQQPPVGLPFVGDKAHPWNSLPSSSNSSGGPSSPTTTASTPTDIIQKLRMFMASQEPIKADQDTDSNNV